jgi:hypothetical protein
MGLMTEAVFQFKAINRRLNRQEQKAEFEEKNPPIPDTSMYGWPYGVASPFELPDLRGRVVVGADGCGSTEAGSLTGILTGGTSTPMLGAAELPPYTPTIAELPSHSHEYIPIRTRGVAAPYGIVTDEQIKNLMLIRGVKI